MAPIMVEDHVVEALLEEEEGGKRLSIPDLYEDHFGGDWQLTLEAYRKLEALRAARRIDDDESTRQWGGRLT